MYHIYFIIIFIAYMLIGMNIFFVLARMGLLLEIDNDDPYFWPKILTLWIVPTFLWPIAMLYGLWYLLSEMIHDQ